MNSIGVCTKTTIPGEKVDDVVVNPGGGNGDNGNEGEGILIWLMTDLKYLLIFYLYFNA